jgi:transglutaminase-like putative cysteine protease
LARAGKTDPRVRAAAVALTAHLPQKDFLGEIAAIFDYVQEETRYVRDPTEVELLHECDALLELRAGDCDDKATILAALLESIGVPTKFMAVGFRPGQLSHVLVIALTDPPLPLDPTEPYPMGWFPPHVVAPVMSIENCDG